MPFKLMEKPKYPPRLWCLVAYPGDGKTTFAVQMRGPLLVVDADHRFSEVLALAGDKPVYQLSETPADNVNPDRIAAILNQEMPGTRVGTIIVDSLTAIITPMVVQAMQDKEHGREKNLAAGFKDKALAMRQLQDAVSKWGTDTLWVYHLMDARDDKGQALTRPTISKTELARLTRSVNMQLQLVSDQTGRRGVKVIWARCGRAGMTVWDEGGKWAGMPERVEAAAYDGLSEADRQKIEASTPQAFANVETALDWGLQRSAFKALPHARNAWDKLAREAGTDDLGELSSVWIAEVTQRLAEKPEPKKRVWKGAQVQGIIRAGLAANAQEALDLLNATEMLTPADGEDVTVEWARQAKADGAALADERLKSKRGQEAGR